MRKDTLRRASKAKTLMDKGNSMNASISKAGSSWHSFKKVYPKYATEAARKESDKEGIVIAWPDSDCGSLCGTPEGYEAHSLFESKPCNACQEAYRPPHEVSPKTNYGKKTRSGAGRRKKSVKPDRLKRASDVGRSKKSSRGATSANKPPVCGTASAYRKHMKEKEKPCQPCIDAHNEDVRNWQRKKRKDKAYREKENQYKRELMATNVAYHERKKESYRVWYANKKKDRQYTLDRNKRRREARLANTDLGRKRRSNSSPASRSNDAKNRMLHFARTLDMKMGIHDPEAEPVQMEYCVCCGVTHGLQVDHIIPISLGSKKGGHHLSQLLQCLCGTCNGSKSDGDFCKVHGTYLGAGEVPIVSLVMKIE